MDLLSAFILILLVMDPLGNVPLFLSALENVAEHRRSRVLVRELVIALGAMLIFLITGEHVLKVLGVRQEAVSIAGAIILGIISLKMIFPRTRPDYSEELEGEPLVVPLAIPLLAGPSVLATLLLLSGQENADLLLLAGALFLAWVATAAVLLGAAQLRQILGRRGLIAVERLMGMVLVAIAVQMFIDGLRVALRT